MSDKVQITPKTTSAAAHAPLRTGVLQRKCACGGTPGPTGECAACRRKRLLGKPTDTLQTKLRINEPGDKFEQEADRVAATVMRMADPHLQRQGLPKTAKTGEGHALLQMKPIMQRQASDSPAQTSAPAIVNDVLTLPGKPLDAATRAFMEPRFGYDFSHVRVHSDSQAVRSAQAVNAQAYTVGANIVFGTNSYAPTTADGQRLLAHELVHVVQQSAAPAIGQAQQTSFAATPQLATGTGAQLQRRVNARSVSCTTGTNNAPADPVADLTAADQRSSDMLSLVQLLTAFESIFTGAGLGGGAVRTAYETRFGLPVAVRGGFLNRLTGTTVATQDEAIGQELSLLARRFELLQGFFGQTIQYRCIGGVTTFAGCATQACTDILAQACAGVGVIFLCPDFWDLTTDEQAIVLIHESSHIFWENVGDVTLRGSGRNFRIAECYASFVADIMGVVSPVEPCPAPP